ncbi:MAG: oxidoreductase [Oligoflexia bacterium]|nr:oxidoreductase [Oligoflexia bacterium]
MTAMYIPLHPLKFKSKIVDQIEIYKNHFILSFTREPEERFMAGQLLALTTAPDTIPPRLYSIASAETAEESTCYQIYYNTTKEGQLSNRLAALKAGDELHRSSPFGQFIFPKSKSYFIAVGTGIAPFLSKIKSTDHFQEVKLLHGAKNLELLLGHEIFSSKLKKNYIPCLSQDSAYPGLFQGRVSDYLQNCDASKLPLDYHYYLCGSAEMVVQTRDILLSKGVPFNLISAEIYF